jgi:hypothetical protein
MRWLKKIMRESTIAMSEDAVVGETTSVAKSKESPPHTRFCQNGVRHASTIGDTGLSLQS